MSKGSCVVTVRGGIVRDPEVRTINGANGSFETVSASLAASLYAKGKGTGNFPDSLTCYFRLNGAGSVLSERMKKLNKGDVVEVIGDLVPNAYKKKDGTEGTSLDVKVFKLDILSYSEKKKEEETVSDNLPF